MNDVARTLAAIDRAIADWEAWTPADAVADYCDQVLGVALLPWQRRWLARLPLLRRQRPRAATPET